MVVVLLVSMLSCFAFSATAAGLGSPVKIQTVVAGAGEVAVGAKPLPTGILVVNKDWKGARGTLPIKLDGVVYGAVINTNGFASLADAVAAANGYDTIYVAAGVYDEAVSINVGGLKIYGPYAGICPNAGNTIAGLKNANAVRPAAGGADPADEAVITGTISLTQNAMAVTLDGLYFGGAGGINGSLAEDGKNRYGMLFQNCIVNSTKSQILTFNSGKHPSFRFINNRVLSAKSVLTITGMTDVEIANNYLNLSEVTMTMKYVLTGSVGSYAKIANNYYPNANGFFYFNNPHETMVYSVMVQDNFVEDMGAAPIVYNTFFARHSLPGINIQVTGNTFLGMEDAPAFVFPYDPSQEIPHRFRYIVNINENRFDNKAGKALFVDSKINGVLNLTNNYFATPITIDDHISVYESSDLFLYPCYEDYEMTVLKGVTLNTTVPGAEVDHENRVITLNYYGTELNYLELDKALYVEEGCKWDLYEEETLTNKITNKRFYFNGPVTERYAKVTSADGLSVSIYKIRVLHDTGTNADLIGLEFSSNRISAPVVEGNIFTYTFPADVAFVDYEIKVSSGATYEVYEHYSQADDLKDPIVPFPELGRYIPYGGFEFDIVVTAEDGGSKDAEKKTYHVVFNRDKSAYYDPSIVDVIAPAGGHFEARVDALNAGVLRATYYCPYLLKKATFDLQVTPGASYIIYKDSALKQQLSSSSNKKEIEVADGISTLYVKVTDKDGSNVIPLTIQNVKRSSDATIIGLTGLSVRINNNEISLQSGGSNVSVNFITRSPYATVKVFADAAKTVEVTTNSAPVEDRDHPNQMIDNRTFALDITHALSYYYVECTAEDGTTVENYKLIVTKIAQDKQYTDITDDDWFYDYVMAASNAGILQGSPDGEKFVYRPNDNTTRQEMAIIASRLLGINCGAFEKIQLPYKDLSSIADWALGYVKVAYKMGVMKGDGTNFKPTDSIARQEVMAMFARMYKLTGSYDLTKFADHAQVAPWAKAEVEAVVASGLIEGDNGYLKPTSAITRAEIATIVSRIK